MSRQERRTKVGTVMVKKLDKTAMVSVSRLSQDRVFKKIMKKLKTYAVHDTRNELQVGDQVEIIETKPVSRTKRWRLSKVLVKSEGAEA